MRILINQISFLVLLIGFLFPKISLGQSDLDSKRIMSIGIKSGASTSSLMIGIPIQKINAPILPSYGLIFSYLDKKIVGIQLEVNFLSKQWEENPIGDYNFNSTLNYIEIPMLTSLHFGNKFKFLINFGPYLSFLINEQSSHTIGQESEYYPYYHERIPKNADFGLSAGAGFRFQSRIGIFQAEGRYTFGFQNLYDPEKSNLDYSNMQTISATISYQFVIFNGR
ncbi:MAG: porin family protein [Bacteroidota bacterium]